MSAQVSAKNKSRFLEDFKRYLPLLQNLVSRDFKIKYRRSFLGVAWSVLNPLLTMIVLTQVFQILLRIQVPNFPTFYIVGVSLWNFFSEATTNSLNSVIGSASLIKKVYIPKYIFPLEKCIFALVNFFFSLIAVIIVIVIQDVSQLSFTALLFPIPVLYCFLFCCGMCLILSSITVYFRDVAHLYGVLLTLWIYLTPILYNMEIFNGFENSTKGKIWIFRLVKKVIEWNPMTHYVSYFRDLVMYHTIPSLKENIICLGMGVVFFTIGCVVFKKLESKFILHI